MERLWKKILISAVLILILFSIAFIQNSRRFNLSQSDEIYSNLHDVPCGNEARFAAVKALFVKKGAANEDITVENFEDVQNILVSKKGKSDETVIVGAHYDKTPAGCGAIDNWSGIVLLANLYQTINRLSPKKNYKFVAFGDEEKGLFGSGAMAKSISQTESSSFCAMVNLDSFGLSHPQVMENVSSRKLTDLARELAMEQQTPFSSASIDYALADSASFKDNGIPAVTFHGLSGDWRSFLHGPNDKIQNVDSESVYLSYLFVLKYLAEIDSLPCGSFR